MSESALPQFLTLDVVAETLSITVDDALSLVESGELLGIRVGRHRTWRVEVAQLELFIQHAYEFQAAAARWTHADFANIPEVADGRII
jgi:prophage regulatory protein